MRNSFFRIFVSLLFVIAPALAWSDVYSAEQYEEGDFALAFSSDSIVSDSTAHDMTAREVVTDIGGTPDTICCKGVSNSYWIKQLIENGGKIHDPGVCYPKFPAFLLKIYDWADKTFNSYDPEYVVGTGKNWKAFGKSYNWNESYRMIFPGNSSLELMSDIYADIGGYVCFMAVSLGYMFNANELLANQHTTRSNVNFSFTCSRFTGDITSYSTKGGTKIKKFGKYEPGKRLNINFDDISADVFSISAYYFFNNRKYSHAAAYCCSKYQLKSAGSWVAGFSFSEQSIDMDFSSLPPEILLYLPSAEHKYSIRNRDYSLSGGYAYNLVGRPGKLLFNFMGLLSTGYRHSNMRAENRFQKSMLALSSRIQASVLYNHKAMFLCMQGRANTFFNFNDSYNFINSLQQVELSIGARF